MTTDEVRELIIIGSGPAGYTAAVYAARAQLRPLVFEGTQFGGALMTTTEVENYPGFTDGIMGPELMEQMRNQAIRFGAELRSEDVEEVSLTGPVKTVTAHGVTYRARAVILAMGAAARYLNVPGEQQLLGRGVSACAVCDGALFRGKDVAVVGGGDTAMEEASYLAGLRQVGDDPPSSRGVPRVEGHAGTRQGHPKINCGPTPWSSTSTATKKERAPNSRHVTGEESTLNVAGMFVAIGHAGARALPRTGRLRREGTS